MFENDSETSTDPSDYEGLEQPQLDLQWNQEDRTTQTTSINPNEIRRKPRFHQPESRTSNSSFSSNDSVLRSHVNRIFHSEVRKTKVSKPSHDVTQNSPAKKQLVRKKLDKRMKMLEETRETKHNRRKNSVSNYDSHHAETIFIPYAAGNSQDRGAVFDASKMEDYQSMMVMFQQMLGNGRILSREQVQQMSHHHNFQPFYQPDYEPQLEVHQPIRSSQESANHSSDHKFIKRVKKNSNLNRNVINQIVEIPESNSNQNKTKIDVAVHLNLNKDSNSSATQKQSRVVEADPPQEPERFVENVTNDFTSCSETDSISSSLRKQSRRKASTIAASNLGTIRELPRSLGPDWAEVEKKAKSLNRRNLYSQTVAAKNAFLHTTNRVPAASGHLSKKEISQQFAKGASIYIKK